MDSRGFPNRSRAEVKSFIGNGVRVLLTRSAPREVDAVTLNSMYKTFVEYYRDHWADKTVPYEGIDRLLSRLRDGGVATALISNKADFAVGLLCDRFYPGLFDRFHGEREGIPRKPDPAGVLDVIRELGADKERTLYVGDSGVDLETAHRAGIDCVLVDWGYLNTEISPDPERDRFASSPDEVFDIVAGK